MATKTQRTQNNTINTREPLCFLCLFGQVNVWRFIRSVERYFVRTVKGTQRADWIVPSPLFTSSHLSIPIQVADVCIYAINWGVPANWFGDGCANPRRYRTEFQWLVKRLGISPRNREGPKKLQCRLYQEPLRFWRTNMIAQKKGGKYPFQRPQGLPVRPSLRGEYRTCNRLRQEKSSEIFELLGISSTQASRKADLNRRFSHRNHERPTYHREEGNLRADCVSGSGGMMATKTQGTQNNTTDTLRPLCCLCLCGQLRVGRSIRHAWTAFTDSEEVGT